MSTSLFERSLQAVPPSSLNYRALRALLPTGRTSAATPDAAPRDGDARAGNGAPARPCLAAVILGRPGWRDAARALGGSFGSMPAGPPARRPE